jgi:hypothetical protein
MSEEIYYKNAGHRNKVNLVTKDGFVREWVNFVRKNVLSKRCMLLDLLRYRKGKFYDYYCKQVPK